MLTVREYLTHDGRNPFREWLGTLDVAVRARVQARVLRFEQANLGRSQERRLWRVGSAAGVRPGYRIYFGKDGESVVLLLVGGAKSTQRRDIRRAQEFWRDYLEGKGHGKTK